MNLYVYSDESGVFDKVHNNWFVFGGLLFTTKGEKDSVNRKYLHAERVVRKALSKEPMEEIKASSVSNKFKGKLYRSLNAVHKFGAVINEQAILQEIFSYKKSRQRFLDYAYKICLKRKLESLITEEVIKPDEIEHLYVFVDEHTTATDGKYELREALEQEFRFGTYNTSYSRFFPPLFSQLKSVDLKFCNSSTTPLVRAADMVANKLFYLARINKMNSVDESNFCVTLLPSGQYFFI